jgi:hypothetical protein
MNLKKWILALAVTPVAAWADGSRHYHRAPVGQVEVGVTLPMPQPPIGVASSHGRYELRQTQQWIPERVEQVWVPEQCTTKYRKHFSKTKCRGGYYSERVIPGRYVSQEQWVWVPYRTVYSPAGVQIQLSGVF